MHGARFLIGLSLFSAVCASAATLLLSTFFTRTPTVPTSEEQRTAWLSSAVAATIDPFALRSRIDRGDTSYVLIDLRDTSSYEEEHIVGALSIPVSIGESGEIGETERVIQAFRELALKHSSKELIVYDLDGTSLVGEQLGILLAPENIWVRQLTIGWNEWRYYWTLWNPKKDWSGIHSEDYIWRGAEPGVADRR